MGRQSEEVRSKPDASKARANADIGREFVSRELAHRHLTSYEVIVAPACQKEARSLEVGSPW